MPRWLLPLGLSWLLACSRAPENTTPEGAVAELLRSLEGIAADPARAKDVLVLLGPQTTKNLEARAQRASKVEGRSITLAAYFSQARFLPYSRVAKLESQENDSGERAEVTALDESGRALTKFSLVKQPDELWRVELPLPELPPLHRRQ